MRRKTKVFLFLTVGMIYAVSRTFGVDAPQDQKRSELEILGT